MDILRLIMLAIAEKTKGLNLPPDQFVVIGSGVLEAHGIRKAADIDVVVSADLWHKLASSGEWQPGHLPNGRAKLAFGEDTEAFKRWEAWSFDELKQDADEIDGILFASLAKVREFKLWRGLDKDMADVQLIDEYLEGEHGQNYH